MTFPDPRTPSLPLSCLTLMALTPWPYFSCFGTPKPLLPHIRRTRPRRIWTAPKGFATQEARPLSGIKPPSGYAQIIIKLLYVIITPVSAP